MGAENQVKAFISVSLHTNNRDTKQVCGHNPSWLVSPITVAVVGEDGRG
jgi:hypothetical protein